MTKLATLFILAGFIMMFCQYFPCYVKVVTFFSRNAKHLKFLFQKLIFK